MKVIDENGEQRNARTNQFGYYKFEDLQVGQTYTFGIKSRRCRFDTQVVNLEEQLDNFNFIANR